MKLAVVAAGDPLDVRTWSGTPYFMTNALQSIFTDVLPIRAAFPPWWHLARRLSRKITAGSFELSWIKTIAKTHADRIARILDRERIDAAVCIANSPVSAYLARNFPVIHVSDATVPLMRDYYQEFSRLPRFLAENALELDRTSVKASRACLYPTEWAARSAIDHYGADPSRVHVIPWGCNIERKDIPNELSYLRTDRCNLVFIGVDWARKGGDIVIDTFEQLLDLGCLSSVDIIGAKPNLRERLRGIRAGGFHIGEHGFINKSTPEGLALFQSIMRQASFLFVPTRQDCYGLVFAEASAYGAPAITTRTGGVPGVVQEGVNGYLLDPSATAAEYAQLIWNVWSDDARYRRLRTSSRRRFESVLNWDAWLARSVNIIEKAAGS
jgi:glycosyltransferase involved in cell wall biosynthesis